MTTNKKILFVGPLPPPLGGVAAINKSFQELFNEAELLIFNTSRKKLNEDLYSGVGISNIYHLIKNTISFILFLFSNKFKIANIFVTSGFAFYRDAFFIFLLRLFNKKIIVHFHSKPKGEYFLTEKRIKYLARILNKADKIIVLSEYHYKHFTKYFEKSKTTIIENFVDYSNFNNKIVNKNNEFLFVGRLSKEKGFFDLIEAVNLIVNKEKIDITINVLGVANNTQTENKINNLIKQYNLNTNIVLHGHISGEDKYKFYKQCSVLLFPSHFENSPVVIKEAIAAKMAIITSDIQANKNILNNIDNKLYFKKGIIEDLATSIIKLFKNKNLRLKYMRNSELCLQYDKHFAKQKLDNLINILS